ncbi:acetyltransferase [Metabacillus idriensis]|uniref:acetyltransferase n=1 Tax=Metabacillus idriensis TaxID=324768 RepID=UPI00174B3AF2|nr:acetyltransferase [Metabacillus idriensis]
MKIVIIGQGGHSKVIRDIISSSDEHQIVGYLDDKINEFTITDNGFNGPISAAKIILEQDMNIKFVIAIGENKIRKRIFNKLEFPNDFFVTLIHQTAVLSPSAKIGNGTVIMANTIINADASIGHHTIINSGSIIEHDNMIGHFVHVSPNSTLTGAVKIEDGVHVGAGTTIIPNINISEWSIIGAGATVVNDIPANCTAVGVPAKVIN